MSNKHLLYLQEIPDTSWVVELISEQFDDAINMMTTNSIVFGNIIRDCLAGKKFVGNLNIAVPSVEYYLLIDRFIKNPKWIRVNNLSKNSLYSQKIPHLTYFKTLGNKIVQITVPHGTNTDPFQTVIYFAKQVNIVCCGIVLTSSGKILEIIPNAYKDCKKNVLCLNKPFNITDFEQFKLYIETLTSRGWINNINMNQVFKNIKRKLKQKKTIDTRINTNTFRKGGAIQQKSIYATSETNTQGFSYIRCNYGTPEGESYIKEKGYPYSLSNHEINLLGGINNATMFLKHVAFVKSLDIIVKTRKNYLTFITKNASISSYVRQELLRLYKPINIQKHKSISSDDWSLE